MSARKENLTIAAMVLLGMAGIWRVAPVAFRRSETGAVGEGVTAGPAGSGFALHGVAPAGMPEPGGGGIAAESRVERAAGPDRVATPALAGFMRRMEGRPEARRRADGSGSLRMNGSATTVAVARIGPDGRIVTECVDSAAALRRSLEGAEGDH